MSDRDEDVIKQYLKCLFKSDWFRGDGQISEDHQDKMGEIMKELHELIENREALLKKKEKSRIKELKEVISEEAQSNEKAIQKCIGMLAEFRFQEADESNQSCINKLVATILSKNVDTEDKIARQDFIDDPDAVLIFQYAVYMGKPKLTVTKFRSHETKTMEERKKYKEKMEQDYKRFLEVRKQAITWLRGIENVFSVLKQDEFWGTRQQLRCGKVVGDMLGGLDPVFGVLLNPTGGLIGPGASQKLHKWLFKEGTPLAFHAAVHDAFGYLRRHHDIGPGYNYLTLKTASKFPLAGQLDGIKFWRNVFEEELS